MTEEEHDWVQRHLQVVFPDVHQHVRTFQTADATLTGRRTRQVTAVSIEVDDAALAAQQLTAAISR